MLTNQDHLKGKESQMAQSARLNDLIARTRNRKMSAEERRAQRVSLVTGLSSHKSTLTREKVETLVGEFEGSTR